MWNFCRPGGSGTEQPSSDAMPARDVLPVSHSSLFLWRATPFPFLAEKRKWSRKTRADEYPRGAGRICNAPSSRTAALGIGPYKHNRAHGGKTIKRMPCSGLCPLCKKRDTAKAVSLFWSG